MVQPRECQVVRLRLSDVAAGKEDPFNDFDEVLSVRHREADEFYQTIIPASLSADHANVMRQALAGMMWTKQFYHYDVNKWLHETMKPGVGGRTLASILDERKLRRVLDKMLDENEFLSEFGIRALSRFHEKHPYEFHHAGQAYGVGYLPGESDSGMFGGNSNWRGPIWMPVNTLIIRALLQYYLYYGDDFTVECPTGSGRHLNLYRVAEEIARRLANIFLRGKDGRRPVYGGTQKFQEDPHWRDLVLFYEYFHGDNGAGLGASHQTGWTGLVARTMHLFATTTPEQVLQLGKAATVTDVHRSPSRETVEAAVAGGS
jgi:hypothetical protein